MTSILYVGIDVDDKYFSCATYCEKSNEVKVFRVRPVFKKLLKELNDLKSKGYELKVCYEATYIGYELCRYLRKNNINCDIIAPSRIPSMPGKQVKTDKIDSINLAKYNCNNMLTPIHIPDKHDQDVRTLIRQREFYVKQMRSYKRKILSLCRFYNINYKQETKAKSYWTKCHIAWLIKTANQQSDLLKKSFSFLLDTYDHLLKQIKEMEAIILEISNHEKYQAKQEILNCFKGIGVLTAMSIICEIGDINRFTHAKKLCAYCGFDIREYSSGGKERKYNITKMGNKRIRTALIEACQFVFSDKISRKLRNARKGKDKKVIDLSERCRKRLRKKSLRMMNAGKNNNVIKTACARELLGFVWEALKLAEAA